MGLVADIAATWVGPRRMIRAKLALGVREDRALITLMAACTLMFLARLPMLARMAGLDPAVPLQVRLAGALLALLFVAPLGFYLVAALSHLIARSLGGSSSGYGARLALFWSLLALSPLTLLQGLLAGLLGDGLAVGGLGLATLAAFVWLWGSALREAGWPAASERPA